MKMLAKKWLVTAGLAMTAVGVQADIHEVDKDVCSSYSAKAVYQYRAQQQVGCGFGGERWNEDGAGQHNWCRTVRPAITEAETQARAEQLIKCLNPSATVNPNDMGLPVGTLNSELSSALSRGALERAQQLIAAGADLQGNADSLMSSALISQDLKVVQFLIKMRIPLNAGDNNPLNNMTYYDRGSEAENKKSLEWLEWLLKSGANPNDTTPTNTPLAEAIDAGNAKAISLLLRYGANPNLDIHGGNCTTIMPLDSAIDKGDDKVIQVLRAAGARQQGQCSGR